MRTKKELYEQGLVFYDSAEEELCVEVVNQLDAFNVYDVSWESSDRQHTVLQGTDLKSLVKFRVHVQGFTEDIILEASCSPYEIDNISYVVKCGSFHSQVEILVKDLSKLEEYVARCVYVYEEKSKQYKELCHKALEALSKPPKSDLEEAVPLVQAVYTKPGITIKEMSNIHHTLGQFEE